MSALRLLVHRAYRERAVELYTFREGRPDGALQCIGADRGDGWEFPGAYRVDRARLARVIHLVPSSRTKVGKAILAGDEHARLRALRGSR